MSHAATAAAATATARIEGALPDDLLPHIAAHAREVDLAVTEAPRALTVRTPSARVALSRDAAGLSVAIDAVDAVTLQPIREYLLHMLDHADPGLSDRAVWEGDIARDRLPLNFCTATLRGITRVAPKFLRVELDCPDTRRLSEGAGMHFSLLLPPAGGPPVWPRLDGNGRTAWPRGADALHRAVYTFVELRPEEGRFTFDLFEHEDGRTTTWASTARPGDVVGLTGPGSGDFPPGTDMLIAGDETALPAIRRILEHSAPDRRGEVLIEVGGAEDIQDLSHPEGMRLTWLCREREESLWDRLGKMEPPPGPDRYVWIAAEKALVRKAKARFRTHFGLATEEGYFAYYWQA